MSPKARRPADTIRDMGGVGWWMAVGLVLAAAVAGCQRRGADSSSTISDPDPKAPPTRDVASLPRDSVTIAERAEWRTRLLWPDGCEDAFRASHAGEAGGMLFVGLGPGVSLVEVTCAAGSYQPSAMRFKLTEEGGVARSTPLSFPVYTSEDGRDLTLSQSQEVWGDSAVNGAAAEIVVLSLARQTADCGVWARYSLAGDQPRLLAAAARVRCPAKPGVPVRISWSGPPSGWAAIARRD